VSLPQHARALPRARLNATYQCQTPNDAQAEAWVRCPRAARRTHAEMDQTQDRGMCLPGYVRMVVGRSGRALAIGRGGQCRRERWSNQAGSGTVTRGEKTSDNNLRGWADELWLVRVRRREAAGIVCDSATRARRREKKASEAEGGRPNEQCRGDRAGPGIGPRPKLSSFFQAISLGATGASQMVRPCADLLRIDHRPTSGSVPALP
jgi:hypothetical protein